MNVLSGAKPRLAYTYPWNIYMPAHRARRIFLPPRRCSGRESGKIGQSETPRAEKRRKNSVPFRKPTPTIRQTNEASARHSKHRLIKRSSDVAFNLRQSWRTRRELRRVSRRQPQNRGESPQFSEDCEFSVTEFSGREIKGFFFSFSKSEFIPSCFVRNI